MKNMIDRNVWERDRLRKKRLDPIYLSQERARRAAQQREARRTGKASPSMSIYVSVKPALYAALKRSAARDDRSMASLLRWLGQRYVCEVETRLPTAEGTP
jgi:hypothetical protein